MKFIEINRFNFQEVAIIYAEGIQTGMATFETKVPDWKNWDKNHLDIGRIALEEDHRIVAWGSLAPVSKRKAYKGVAEISVYVARNLRGKGLGKKMLKKLIAISEEHHIWTIQAGIMRENETTMD